MAVKSGVKLSVITSVINMAGHDAHAMLTQNHKIRGTNHGILNADLPRSRGGE